jgi:hypothetical protein
VTDFKRFSLRHGLEKVPDKPIFDDAPDRLRYFLLDYLKSNFEAYIARQIVAKVLCIPDLLT